MSTERQLGLRATLSQHARAADAALVATVPIALLAVFALPESTRAAYVLDYRAPAAVDMYASHFVHFGVGHLATNVATYLLAVVPTYGYCVAAGRRTDFLAVFGAVLAIFPYALSWLNVVFVRPSIGYGFSGLAMAFLGFLPVALAAFARERLADGVTLDHAPLLFFAGAATSGVLVASSSSLALVVVAVSVAAAAVYARSLWLAVGREGFEAALGRAGDAEFAAAGVVLVLAAPFVAFPGQTAGSGSVLNVYSHLLGFCLGFLVPFTALRLAAAVE